MPIGPWVDNPDPDQKHRLYHIGAIIRMGFMVSSDGFFCYLEVDRR